MAALGRLGLRGIARARRLTPTSAQAAPTASALACAGMLVFVLARLEAYEQRPDLIANRRDAPAAAKSSRSRTPTSTTSAVPEMLHECSRA